MTVYLAIPLLREFNNLKQLLFDINYQNISDMRVIFCVNNPDVWSDDDIHNKDIDDNIMSLNLLSHIENVEQLLNNKFNFNITVLDKCTKDNAFSVKKSGVGWARKLLMDRIAEIGNDDDLIVSMDADTHFECDYLSSVVTNFRRHKDAIALCVPYYHPLSNDDELDRCMLRYELYMRHYMINMLRINNPYSFTALGSAMVFPIKSYKKVRGIVPRQSGEDFYLMQNLRKSGDVLLWNENHVYPQGRFSDRVAFGTGPAMIKGSHGDWNSYPFYKKQFFDDVAETFETFPQLYEKDIDTPMTSFLKTVFKTDDLWSPLRKNYKSVEQFVHACIVKVDALRILQFLRFSMRISADQVQDKYSSLDYSMIRDNMYHVENEYRMKHDMYLQNK